MKDQEQYINKRMCQVTRDNEGDVVAKFNRRCVEEPHPNRGATSPHPTRVGWVVDWIWPMVGAMVILAIGLVAYL